MTMELVQRLDRAPLAVVTEGLTKHFGAQVALDGVDLTVPEGAIYVLVGPNGAGKSTTLKALLDLVRPDAGSAWVHGLSVSDEGPAVRAEIGYVAEGVDFGYSRLTARQLFSHHARYYRSWDPAYANELSREFEVRLDTRFGKLSKGQARRAQLVTALAHRPRLLLLDEPTDGLDPLGRDTVLARLAEHAASSPTTMIVSTHVIHELEGLGDCLGALREGRLIAQLNRAELESRLHRVRAEVAEGWEEGGLADLAIYRKRATRELDWVVWGEREALGERFREAGVTVRQLAGLNLEEATRAILRMEIRGS